MALDTATLKKQGTALVVAVLIGVGAVFGLGDSVSDAISIAFNTDKAKAACSQLLDLGADTTAATSTTTTTTTP